MNKIETIIVYDESKSDVKDFFANKVNEQANNRIELCHELGYEDLSNFNQYALPHLVLILLYPTELLSDISNLIENLSKTETNIFVIQCTEIFELHSNQWIHEKVIKITKGIIDPDCVAKERSDIIYLDEIANSDMPDFEISTYFIFLLEKFTFSKEKSHPVEEIDIVKNVKGFTVVDIPGKMKLKQKYICKIKIGKDRALLSEIITTKNENEIIFDNISVGKKMTAELKNSENFKINLINNKTQVITEDGIAEWIFEVIPQDIGMQILYIVISIVYEDGLQDIPFTKEIEVEVSRNKWSFLKFILPLVLVGFFFSQYAFRQHSSNKPEYSSNQHSRLENAESEPENENAIIDSFIYTENLNLELSNKTKSIKNRHFSKATKNKNVKIDSFIYKENLSLRASYNTKNKKYRQFFETSENENVALDSIFEKRYFTSIAQYYNIKTKKVVLLKDDPEKAIEFLESFYGNYPNEYAKISKSKKKCTLEEWLDAIMDIYGLPEKLQEKYNSNVQDAAFKQRWAIFFQAYYDLFGDKSPSKNQIIKICKSLKRA